MVATPRERDQLIQLLQALNEHERQHAKFEVPGWLRMDEFPVSKPKAKRAVAEMLLKGKAKGRKVTR